MRLAVLGVVLALALPPSAVSQPTLPLDQRWYAVNDNVMGGVSEGRPEVAADGILVFSGRVSLENNGGFASIRRTVEAPLSGTALVATIRTDGKRYRMTAYSEVDSRGLQYSAPLAAPAGVWTRVRLPAEAFRASFRGRPLPDAPPFAVPDSKAVGFIVSDGQAGPFRLEIRAIEAE